MDLRHLAGFPFDPITEIKNIEAEGAGPGLDDAERLMGRDDDPGQIVGAQGPTGLVGNGEPGEDRVRNFEPVAAENRECVLLAGGVGHRRPRCDDGGIVARHIGENERVNARLAGGAGEPAAFDARHVLAHAVELGNVGAAFEERAQEPDLLAGGDARRRQRHER